MPKLDESENGQNFAQNNITDDLTLHCKTQSCSSRAWNSYSGACSNSASASDAPWALRFLQAPLVCCNTFWFSTFVPTQDCTIQKAIWSLEFIFCISGLYWIYVIAGSSLKSTFKLIAPKRKGKRSRLYKLYFSGKYMLL